MIDETTIVQRAGELMQTEIDDELVALDVARGTCFGFNATATRIWALTEQPTTIGAIVDRLTQEYAVDRGECAVAVADLLTDFAERGLVRLGDA